MSIDEKIQAKPAAVFAAIAREREAFKADSILKEKKEHLMKQAAAYLDDIKMHEASIERVKCILGELAKEAITLESLGVCWADAPWTLVHAPKVLDEKETLENFKADRMIDLGVVKKVLDVGKTRRNIEDHIKKYPENEFMVVYKESAPHIQRKKEADE